MAGTPDDAHLWGELIQQNPAGVFLVFFLTLLGGAGLAFLAITEDTKN